MSYNEGIRTLLAAAAVTRGQRIKLDATAEQGAVAGAGENGVGFSDRTVASGEPMPVRLDAPTSVAIANGAVSWGDVVYQAAAGAVSATPSGRKVGICFKAATDGNETEVMPQVYSS